MLSPPHGQRWRRGPSGPGRTGSTCAPMKRRNCRASSASSTDLPGTGRPDDQRVADIADVQIEPERRAAARLRHHQRRRAADGALLSGPAHTADTGIM